MMHNPDDTYMPLYTAQKKRMPEVRQNLRHAKASAAICCWCFFLWHRRLNAVLPTLCMIAVLIVLLAYRTVVIELWPIVALRRYVRVVFHIKNGSFYPT